MCDFTIKNLAKAKGGASIPPFAGGGVIPAITPHPRDARFLSASHSAGIPAARFDAEYLRPGAPP